MDEITKLADILRDQGDKILNNESKLILSWNLLKEINNYMNYTVERFYQVKYQNAKKNTYLEFKFLCDFIQRTESLKLTSSSCGRTCSEFVDISVCKHLKLLETYKINVNLVLGIKSLRSKIEYLICERSINSLAEILKKCGGDNSDGDIWDELKEASFTHNNLHVIENSIEYIPRITSLDLSHNVIENADMLCCLSNLKYLNLGYNKLDKIPSLLGPVANRLQVLVLSNNFIEDIQEAQILLNLCELDLSENCLIEHSLLVPLACLATLQFLNLKGNPLSYHPRHRIKTSQYLHISTATVKFVLDELFLNNSEKELVGSLHPKLTCRGTNSLSASTSYDATSERNRRIRHVTITESSEPEISNASEMLTTSLNAYSTKPLQTKKQISKVSEEYMKSLYSKSSWQNLSLPASSTPLNFFDDSKISEKTKISSSQNLNLTDKDTSKCDVSTKMNEIVSESTNNTYITAPESLAEWSYDKLPNPSQDSSEDEELESGESNIFIAKIKESTDEIFVIITKTHLAEKDQITTKGLGRFALESLMVCELVEEDGIPYIYLKFDTLKKDNTRYYNLQVEEAKRFYDRLKEIVNNRLPLEPKYVNYHCMKCSSKFSVIMQKTIFKEKVKCSTCSSDLVFEDDN